MAAASIDGGAIKFLRAAPIDSVLEWEEERVFHESDQFFESVCNELDRARSSIEIEMYIFEDDACGEKVIERLKSAAGRGVAVRLMIDGIGTPNFRSGPLLAAAGIEVRTFHPPPWPGFALNYGFSRAPDLVGKLFSKLNRRNHRKIFVIDNESAWVGSMNISACHLRSEKGENAWRDTGVRVRGVEVKALREAFESAWERIHSPLRKVYRLRLRGYRLRSFWDLQLVRLNLSTLLRRRYAVDLLRKIRSAKNRVWIASPYFVPTRSVLRALRGAARNGCDVRVLVPSKSDVFFMPAIISAFYHGLLKADVRVFEYLPRFLHSKIVVVDNWMLVGTSNMNHRSFFHDLEVDIVMTKAESKKSIIEQFECDFAESHEITLEESRRRPLHQRIIGRIAFSLRHWM